MSEPNDISGGKLFYVDNEKCFAIGSKTITQSDLEKISTYNDLKKVLFYFVKFNNVDFSIFEKTGVNQFTFLHGNFSEKELRQACKLKTLKTVQLLDTQVSENELASAKEAFSGIIFK